MRVIEQLKAKLSARKVRNAERALARREQKMPSSATAGDSGKGGGVALLLLVPSRRERGASGDARFVEGAVAPWRHCSFAARPRMRP
jgi:hypothetical protein